MKTVTETRHFTTRLSWYINFLDIALRGVKSFRKSMIALSQNLRLKTLNPTRWSGRYDAVYALK